MPVISHALIALGYVVVAGVFAILLPGRVEAIDARLAVELGGLIILISGLVHLAAARLNRGDAEAAEIEQLKAGNAELRAELGRARNEAKRIHEAIKAGTEVRQGQAQTIDAVASEVKVLQDLVEQLSQGKALRGKPAYFAKDEAKAGASAGPRMVTGLSDEAVLEMVRDALKNSRVDLFVQPIVSLPQRKRRHYECFSRVRGEGDLILTPDQYLPVAEREGLIAAIDNMLLFRGVQLVRRLQKHNADAGIFVNISEHTLADMRFMREFVSFMGSNKDLAPYLVFEFTQGSIERHGGDTIAQFGRLGELGFRLSMDQVTSLDFDVGELARLHIRFLKIEAGKLMEQTRAANQRLDIHAFKRALDSYAIDLIVEKIENEKMLLELLDMPIDFGQGYLFGEPRPSKETRDDG
jgi:cyclic-di-GMP phosphodiesterase TipF (flagellum assembly factor)